MDTSESDRPPRFRRVVLKLSGEALAGDNGWGVDPQALDQMAEQILQVHRLGVQIGVVVGGGNYFRGRMADSWGSAAPRPTTSACSAP